MLSIKVYIITLSLTQNFLFLIMNNRPFFSTNTNVYDQSIFSAAPTNFNGQNLLISQEQQRKMFDTLNTSIMGLPQGNTHLMNNIPGNFLQAQKQLVPGGVLFTFNSQPAPPSQGFLSQQVWCTNPNNVIPTTLEQQIAMSGLHKHGLESLQYQQQLSNNPFQLRFHLNTGTSCSDLLNASSQIQTSQSTPDFNNVGGVLKLQSQETCTEKFDDCCNANLSLPLVDFPRNIKKLTLSKPPTKPSDHVADVLDEEKKDTAESKNENTNITKKVCFADEHNKKTKEDKSQQALMECTCNAPSKKNKKHVRKKVKSKSPPPKVKKENDSLSESTEEESSRESRIANRKRSRRYRVESDSQYFSSDSN